MLPTKAKKAELMAQHHGLRSRLIAPFTGRNSENSLPGLEHKQHLRLLEVTSHDETSRLLQAKRKPHLSPQGPAIKRTAFSDVTNVSLYDDDGSVCMYCTVYVYCMLCYVCT
jgi:hypothetical protein